MLRIQLLVKLASVDRERGREQEARAIEADVLKLLAEADPDYPLLVELKARQQLKVLQHPPRADLKLQSGDSVLITYFENRTGDPALDNVAEYALERELANSRVVTVVPRRRVEETLRLMRKPPETRVDVTIGAKCGGEMTVSVAC